MLKQLKVSRRFALRGAVSGIGVSLWLPVLDAMCNDHGTAFAQGHELPTSFGIFYWGNGLNENRWRPTETGVDDQWQLSPDLQAFEAVKEYLTIVSGTQMLDGKFKGHGWGVAYILAGGDSYPASVISDINGHPVTFEKSDSTHQGPTLDQIVADVIGNETPFSSLETGIMPYKGLNMGTVSKALAHRGPYDFLPPEQDPAKLFDRLFSESLDPTMPTPGSGDGPTPIEITHQLRRSVLDAVLDEANSLKAQLGADDRMRLERHMQSVRAIEERIPNPGDNPNPASCETPVAPTETDDTTERSHLMNRMIASALACNLTRVYTHLWSGARDDNPYPVVGINGDHHTKTHGGNAQQADAADISSYILEQYADLANVMKETSIGAGNLLDQTLLYGISELAHARNHHHTDYPVTIVGKAGGKLRGNIHHRAKGNKVNEVALTLLKVMGVDIDEWGSWDKTNKVMSEILT